MLKTLLKKEFLHAFGKIGLKNRGGNKSVVKYVILLAIISVYGGAMFFAYSYALCAPLVEAQLGWLYFVYGGILSVALAIVGGVFMAQSTLYEAKDNELLLSLPIPPKYILFIRMAPLYAQNFLFGAIVLVPSCICWCLTTTVTFAQVIIWLLMLFIMPFLSLFISCALGLLIALATSRMRDKTLVTVIISIIFIIGYTIVYSQIMSYVSSIVENSAGIGESIKRNLYPVYKFGTAMTGDFVGFIITFAIIAVLFGALYFALSKTYIKLVTTKHGGIKTKYNGKVEKPVSPTTALIKKEVRRFFSSGIYFLNCGLGVIMMFIAVIMVIINLNSILANEAMRDLLPLIAIGGVCGISAMNMVSAPSISLEGQTLWILQSTPTKMWGVLKAKLCLHELVTAPAAVLCSAVLAILFKAPLSIALFMLIIPIVVVLYVGALGLIINLKNPNLKWENETVVIKQSGSVLWTMLIGMGTIGVLAAAYFITAPVMPAVWYLLIVFVILSAVSAGLIFWLRQKGTRILEEL